jgi:hypothetical protein
VPRVLEEVTESEISREHIEQRVNDWARRIDQLYAQIESWLPNGCAARRNRTVRMDEELMRKYQVSPRELPILDIVRGEHRVAHIEPRALWIVGANGRLDFLVGSTQYIIVDDAENFHPASWMIAQLSDRRRRRTLDRDTFSSVIQG